MLQSIWHATKESLKGSFDKFKDSQDELSPSAVVSALADAGIHCTLKQITALLHMYINTSRRGLSK